jgi:hypothetical protein
MHVANALTLHAWLCRRSAGSRRPLWCGKEEGILRQYCQFNFPGSNSMARLLYQPFKTSNQRTVTFTPFEQGKMGTPQPKNKENNFTNCRCCANK